MFWILMILRVLCTVAIWVIMFSPPANMLAQLGLC